LSGPGGPSGGSAGNDGHGAGSDAGGNDDVSDEVGSVGGDGSGIGGGADGDGSGGSGDCCSGSGGDAGRIGTARHTFQTSKLFLCRPSIGVEPWIRQTTAALDRFSGYQPIKNAGNLGVVELNQTIDV
jgi:hypothetical protein